MRQAIFALFFLILCASPVFAEKPQPILGSLAAQNAELRQQIKNIQANLSSINKVAPKLSSVEADARKMMEISDKNLAAPNLVLTAVFAVLGIVATIGAAWGFVIKNKLQDKIDEIKKFQDNIQAELFPIIAAQRDREAIQDWDSKNYLLAIDGEQQAINYLMKINGNNKHDYPLAKYESNLAYYYADAGMKDKRGEAIELASAGLEAGKRHDNLDLIDNFLFVIMRLSNNPDDKRNWKEVYEVYSSEIFKREIRKNEEEGEFRAFYEECKKIFEKK